MSRAPADPPSDARVWSLDGPRVTMMDSLASALVVVRSAIPRAMVLPADIDIVAAEGPVGESIIAAARSLAESLVEEMVVGDAQPSLFARDEDSALGALRAATDNLPIRPSRTQWKDALGDAAAIIREIGLERYDLDCFLGTDPSGANVIVSTPIPAATAHVWLLDRLLQRAEAFVLTDELLVSERMASAWYFSMWSVGRGGKAHDAMDFTRRVREQEWSLIDRVTVTFDETVIAALARDERFDRIPKRQQRLARALAASVLDIFVVEAVHDDHLTLRSVRGGRAHRVHEHNPDARLSPGYFVIGRLIPFDQGLWLRSPGTISFSPRRPDEAAVLADALQRASAAMPLAVGLGALISAVVLGAKPPLSRKPVPSAREAGELVEFLTEALDRLGRREEVTRDELPNELDASMPPAAAGAHFYRFAVDDALAEWIGALSAQAESRGSPPATETPGSRGKPSALTSRACPSSRYNAWTCPVHFFRGGGSHLCIRRWPYSPPARS